MSHEIRRVKGASALDPANLFTERNMGNPPPAAPAAAAPAMPDPDGDAVAAAKRRKAVADRKRGGRESTILADKETFGG